MKHIKYIALAFIGGLAISCETNFLEPVPEVAVSSAGYFQDDEQIETGVIGIYDAIQGVNSTSLDDNRGVQIEYYVTEMRSDNTRTKSQEGEAAQFEEFNVTTQNGLVANYYRSFFNVIYRANLVLDNLENATTGSSAKFEAEAKFARAYAYFNLVRLFGDLPLVDALIGPLDTDVAFTRVPAANIYELIVSDFEFAANNLDNSQKNRASRAAAQGLLAKVHLTLGNYTQAQVLCESIIGGDYSLASNFSDIFYNESNNEVIFAVGYNPGVEADSQDFSAEWMNGVGRTAGVNYVTNEAIEALEAFGGNRAALSYRQDLKQATQYQVTKYLPNGEDGGADGKSFNTDATMSGNDWIVLRYADVLLMHVESILAGGQATSAAAAISSFKQVRNRAGISDTVSEITKQDLLNERRVEFAFENQRLFDLIRFGVAQEQLSAFSGANGYGFSATDLLLPIPQREINLSNGKMTQNPGY